MNSDIEVAIKKDTLVLNLADAHAEARGVADELALNAIRKMDDHAQGWRDWVRETGSDFEGTAPNGLSLGISASRHLNRHVLNDTDIYVYTTGAREYYCFFPSTQTGDDIIIKCYHVFEIMYINDRGEPEPLLAEAALNGQTYKSRLQLVFSYSMDNSAESLVDKHSHISLIAREYQAT